MTRKSDKAREVWYRLLQNSDFEAELKKLRVLFHQSKSQIPSEYFFWKNLIFKKFDVIPSERLHNLFDQHFFGETISRLGENFTSKIQTPSDRELSEEGRSFIKIWIYDGASKEEILHFINKRWKTIRALIGMASMPKVRRVREIAKKDQREAILNLAQLSFKELARLDKSGLPTTGTTKSILIRRLLKDRYPKLSAEAVKMTMYRYGTKRPGNS